MPTHRQAHFIRRALDSLQAQTLADWEVLIVDDGSCDDTPDVVLPYLIDQRIGYFRLGQNTSRGNVDQASWVREFSRYDAGWLHAFQNRNGGEIRRADWDDLNSGANGHAGMRRPADDPARQSVSRRGHPVADQAARSRGVLRGV